MFVPAETEKRPSHFFHWEESAHWLALHPGHISAGTWNQRVSLRQEDFREDGDCLFDPSHEFSLEGARICPVKSRDPRGGRETARRVYRMKKSNEKENT